MLDNINWSELFPTKLSAVIFVSYMVLFINQGIFVTASQSSNSAYSYNTVTVVLLTEVVKLVISVILYCKDNSATSLILFKKKLSSKQWLSLILLTAGCMIKQIDLTSSKADPVTETTEEGKSTETSQSFHLSINLIFIFVQTVCSCLAGVYNEYLLKGDGADVNIFVQNVFMYLDSIVCNAGILLCQRNLFGAFTMEALATVFQFKVILIMFNNAAIGIITSFFLKNLNSILKTFASALELMFTAILCWILFGIPIYINTIIAISVVSYAVVLYSQNPVVNQGKPIHESEKEKFLNPEPEEV
ncbi:hypothetical protein C0J52_20207 [Blattella germanica]|nr:hypothetical protein C0J52_20207 [Blattella germanica]